jgi:hypothetical protein
MTTTKIKNYLPTHPDNPLFSPVCAHPLARNHCCSSMLNNQGTEASETSAARTAVAAALGVVVAAAAHDCP